MLGRSQIYTDKTTATDALNPLTSAPAGSVHPHDNKQPTLCLNYIIALEGVYPSRN